MMFYFLSHMEFSLHGMTSKITQLVLASDKNKAREAVERSAKKDQPDIIILSIRVDELIIAE